MDVGY